ncbi:hypothetical protein CK556_01100 [Mesoplasma chauliocola]|uniref:Uncharacterized protein n=1 Tax=Mesoplasma chauliocola TaxID=216427 RepID=A0A249SMQ2_9MOLU|nr:hypothetical protein [Mesoplasma chauliocola]ASZ08955.1 hypothetical protein CK556_01100 [Mesoplasma chauliocola]
MDKQLSRSEIHKDYVEEVNKKFAKTKANLSLNTYVMSSLEALKNIDNDFFTKVEKILTQEYDNVKFHLEHDPELKQHNYEVLTLLNESLQELKKIQDYELSNTDKDIKNSEIIFSEKEFYKKELENLLEDLVARNQMYLERINESNVYKTDYAGEHGETLAKSFLSTEEKIAINNEIKRLSFGELSKEIEAKQREKMHNLDQNKKRFKIRIKLFYIAFGVFIAIGLIGLVVIFLI